MSINEYWQQYLKKNNLPLDETYTDAWPFGDNPDLADELLQLIIDGKKTTTTGLLIEHQHHGWKVPEIGDRMIILDGRDEPACIIEIIDVELLPFKEMNDVQFAQDEGEGFDTLDIWRDVHRRFFKRVLTSIDKKFDDKMIVICERFRLIYS